MKLQFKDIVYICIVIVLLIAVFIKPTPPPPNTTTVDSLRNEIFQRNDTIQSLVKQDKVLQDSISRLKNAVRGNDIKIKELYKGYEVKIRVIDSANVVELQRFFTERYGQ